MPSAPEERLDRWTDWLPRGRDRGMSPAQTRRMLAAQPTTAASAVASLTAGRAA